MKPNWLVLLYEQLRVSLEKGCGKLQQGDREQDSSFWGILPTDHVRYNLKLHPAKQQKRTVQAQRHKNKSLRYKISYK